MRSRRPTRFQAGATVVEFAFAIVLLVVITFGMLELGRAVHTWNACAQATRAGARTAAIVAVGDTIAVRDSMRESLPDLEAGQFEVLYSADGYSFGTGCASCAFVQVRLTAAESFFPIAWRTQFGTFLPERIARPDFATTVPVEALGNT